MNAPKSVAPIKTAPDTASEAAAPSSGSSSKTAVEVAREARKRRARALTRSLLVWVGLPTLLAILYYGFIASDEYVSGSTVMLRSRSGVPNQDAQLVREFLTSRDALLALDADGNLSKHFRTEGDFLAAMRVDAGVERRVEYMRRHVAVKLESGNGILRLSGTAFSGAQASAITRGLVDAATHVLADRGFAEGRELVLISAPSEPDEPAGPRRGYGVLTTFFASLALYAIVALLIAAVREHAQF